MSRALALRQGMSVHELSNQMFPYLILVEGRMPCAQAFGREVTQLSCRAGENLPHNTQNRHDAGCPLGTGR